MFSKILGKLSLQLALIMEGVVFTDKSVNTTKQHNITSPYFRSHLNLLRRNNVYRIKKFILYRCV